MPDGVGCKVVGVEHQRGGTEVILLPNEAVVAIGQIIQNPDRFYTNSKLAPKTQKGYINPERTYIVEAPKGCELLVDDPVNVYFLNELTLLAGARCANCQIGRKKQCPVYDPVQKL